MSISAKNYSYAGWLNLHKSAIMRGAEVEYDPVAHPFLQGKHYLEPFTYSSLLGNFPTRCGIELGTEICQAEFICDQVWAALEEKAIRLAKFEWKEISNLRTFGEVMNACQSRNFIYRHPAHSEWKQGDLRLLAKKTQAILTFQGESEREYIRSAIWALAILGAVSESFTHRGLCEFCFRLVWPGRRFCRFHSQAKPYIDNESRAYLRYRTGRKAFLLAKSRGLSTFIQAKPIIFSIRALEAIADLLFPLQQASDFDEYEHKLLFHQLPKCPKVLALLGGEVVLDQPHQELVALLRAKLDPDEWDNVIWGMKIVAAEKWLELEEEVSPGRKPRSAKTLQRIREAQRLFRLGYKHKEIAESLEISPSALSKWKSRGLLKFTSDYQSTS